MEQESLEVKVTNINGVYHARVIENGKVLDEMSCTETTSIGWMCREMLRWQDKLGNHTAFTSASRKRHNENDGGRPADVKYCRNRG